MTKTTMLPLKFENNGMIMRLTPVIIESGDNLILVDCGNPGLLELLEGAIKNAGYAPEALTKVMITHHDHDHFGSLAALKRKYPKVKICASELEVPYLEGEKKSLRLVQAESIYDTLPEERKEWARGFHAYLEGIEKVKVDTILKDGDALDEAGKVIVIATPGHMPGHMSVIVTVEKTLISGDALIAEEGTLMMANPQYSLDLDEARRSAIKLSHYELERVICYHGGVVEGNISEILKTI
ncbi:MBL fold metallo-hydrolase [Fusibacter bizertensis]|uniref:MBL fold metallo-hydrolase n=1 Tax=Fusibacter bizertensis TaxID=1488331 RepID=A0ABT6NAT6_9FIRM|nr:MBL fold metallo-hydrolase [Fusibacter bizertensis]MDH8677519.1 MBL fold metallo-hydrolase [Fusibacter bizertensis]